MSTRSRSKDTVTEAAIVVVWLEFGESVKVGLGVTMEDSVVSFPVKSVVVSVCVVDSAVVVVDIMKA